MKGRVKLIGILITLLMKQVCFVEIQYQFVMMQRGYEDHLNSNSLSSNHSCNQIIQKDQIDCQETTKLPPRATKSQNQLTFYHPSSKTQHPSKQQQLPPTQTGNHPPPIEDLNNYSKTKGLQFDSQMVDSEEFELENESINSQTMQKLKLRKHSEFVILAERFKRKDDKPIQRIFNVLILGRQGSGKSTFIQTYFHKKFSFMDVKMQIKGEYKLISGSKSIGNFKMSVNFIDLNGYTESSLVEYESKINHLIDSCFQNSLKRKRQLNGIDSRLHVCLYFLAGGKIYQEDWQLMKQIQKKINIIPIISKADTFTSEEIKNAKRMVLQKNQKERVDWFDGEEIMRQKYPAMLQKLTNGKLGKVPPFVISTGKDYQYNQKSKEKEIVRNYRWGKCWIEQQQITDFRLLKEMLVAYFSDILISKTDQLENSYLTKKNQIKQAQILHSQQDHHLTLENHPHKNEPVRQSKCKNIGLIAALATGFCFFLYKKIKK